MATTPGTSPLSIPLRRTWSICGNVCMASSRFIDGLFRNLPPARGGRQWRTRGGRAFAQAFALRHKGRARIVSVKDGSQGSAIVMAGLGPAIHGLQRRARKPWMAGTRPAAGPAMTVAEDRASESEHQRAADHGGLP